jgi:hypothetical protein
LSRTLDEGNVYLLLGIFQEEKNTYYVSTLSVVQRLSIIDKEVQ